MANNPIVHTLRQSQHPHKDSFRQSTVVFSILLLILLTIIFRSALFGGLTLSSIGSNLYSSGFYSELYETASQFNENSLVSSDNERVWVPTGKMLYRELAQGHLSKWNPYASNGMPFFAEEQTQVNDPVYLLLHLFFAPEHAVVLFTLLSFFLAGMFMFMLARTLSISWHGASLCGISYMLSGPLVSWYLRPNSQVYVFIPLLFYAFEKGQKTTDVRWKILAGFSLALMFVCGHTQIAVLALFAYEIILLCRFFSLNTSNWKKRLSFLLSWNLIPGLTTFGLIAYKLLPFIELCLRTPVMEYGRSGLIPLTWPKFLNQCLIGNFFNAPLETIGNMTKLIFPFFYGSPASEQKFAFDTFFYQPFGGNFAETACYFGVISLTLCLPMLLRFRQETRQLRSYLILFSFSILLCFNFPLVSMVRALPLLNLIKMDRFYFVLCLTGALLAGRGLDIILTRSYRQRNGYLMSIAILATGIIFIIHRYFPSTSPITHAYYYALLPLLFLGLLIIVSLLSRPHSMLSNFLPLAIVLLVILDGLHFVWNYMAFQPPEIVHPQTARSRLLGSYANPLYRMKYYGNFIPSYHLAYDGLMMDATFSVLQIKRQNELIQAVGHIIKAPTPSHRGTLSTLSPKWLNFNAIGLVGIDQYFSTDINQAALSDNLQPIYLDNDITLWKNTTVVPRFRMYSTYTITDNLQVIADEIISRNSDGKTAMVSSETPPHFKPQPSATASLQVISISNDTMNFEVTTTNGAILASTDSWYPGWKAEIDQKPAPLLRIFHAFRGVEVPSGSHDVRMYYDPISFTVGMTLTIAALFFGATFFSFRFFLSRR